MEQQVAKMDTDGTVGGADGSAGGTDGSAGGTEGSTGGVEPAQCGAVGGPSYLQACKCRTYTG